MAGRILLLAQGREFQALHRPPGKVPLPLELALEGLDAQDEAKMIARGWQIISARALSDPLAYRNYICDSLGEFTVTKDQYVRPRTGGLAIAASVT
jgi:hypothetical protein